MDFGEKKEINKRKELILEGKVRKLRDISWHQLNLQIRLFRVNCGRLFQLITILYALLEVKSSCGYIIFRKYPFSRNGEFI